jgi:hypothetical protein
MIRLFIFFGFKNDEFLHDSIDDKMFGSQKQGRWPHFGAYGTKNGKVGA